SSAEGGGGGLGFDSWPSGSRGPLRLRDWLVAQIESGRYAGLRWEDEGKTLFRIPWKHAAKQGYRAQQDAALFRAWAIYKGKHVEGIDKDDPSTWKTRLRCALNKSADFCEVHARSQLDISNPYKVYRIVSDGTDGPVAITPSSLSPSPCLYRPHYLHPITSPPSPMVHCSVPISPSAWSISLCPLPPSASIPLLCPPISITFKFPRWGLEDLEVPCPVGCGRGERVPPTRGARSASSLAADCWLHVRLFYGAELVREATARTAEGCRLSPRAAAAAAERLLGPPRRMAQVRFPEPPPGARVLQRLLPHLERGVLLWVAPEGVFAKRLCQGRVYWRGPLAPHRARPNKLERERTCQLLDTRRFLAELRAHLQDGHPEPEYQIRLCFGEEYPGPPDQPEERLIMAHSIRSLFF
uniref:IRF tryptophan pentad repeat domain-containing protein n=1 Tax=Equus asinus asinus TaxID=83772 RepID=A0A8C4L1N7_EQUAS